VWDEQQGGLVLHRTRHLLIRQQTSVINAIRGHLAEFGIVAPVGRKGVEDLLRVIADANDKRVPEVVGLRRCWPGDRRRSRLSRSPISLPEWPGH
jgi:transposase